jgi:hypothetical protein
MGRVSFALVVLVLVAGCASSTGEAARGSEQQVTTTEAGLRAEIETVPLVASLGKCEVATSYLKVSGIDASAAFSINAKLARSMKDYATEEDCAEFTYSVDGGMTAAFNERGILTVTLSESSYYEGAAHPNHSWGVLNFDLRTGAVIDLDQAIDAAGRQIIIDKCTSVLGEGDLDNIFVGYCTNAVTSSEYGTPTFAVETEGLRIHPTGLPHASFPQVVEGALVPWTALRGHITHDLVRAVAK